MAEESSELEWRTFYCIEYLITPGIFQKAHNITSETTPFISYQLKLKQLSKFNLVQMKPEIFHLMKNFGFKIWKLFKEFIPTFLP